MTRTALASLDAVLRAGGPHLPGLMGRVEERLRELAVGHGPLLAEHAEMTVAAGGKRLRPLLVFLGAGEPSGDGLSESVVRAAVAVELIHSATLVHDDVLDDAELRRGRPSVVATAGRGIATATGDLLFSRAFAELTRNGRAEEVRVLSAASSALAEGELLQRADAWSADVDPDRYLQRCELKTAALFAAACELGALEGATDRVSAAGELALFGRRVGLAFQLLDDVLDVSGSPEHTGKRRGADLLDGTVTLPLILARQKDSALAQLDLRTIRSEQAAAELCDRIEATGAVAQARERALGIVSAAKAELPDLEPEQRSALELVADAVVERYA